MLFSEDAISLRPKGWEGAMYIKSAELTTWIKILEKKVIMGHLSNYNKVSLSGMESVR